MTALYVALIMAGHNEQGLKSTEVISKCLAKYAEAKSGVGEITMTQNAGPKKIQIKTDLQFERPSKLFIHQTSEALAPNDWLVVSDGVNFGYDIPNAQEGTRRRLFEAVAIKESTTGASKTLKIQDIFMAAKRSLGDVLSPYVEFATQTTGENQSLRGFINRFSKIEATPKEKTLADGTPIYSISGLIAFGNLLQKEDGTPLLDKDGNAVYEGKGRFELQIGKEFDLLGMRTTESMEIKDAATNLPTMIQIVTIWSGKLNLNQTPADTIFKVK